MTIAANNVPPFIERVPPLAVFGAAVMGAAIERAQDPHHCCAEDGEQWHTSRGERLHAIGAATIRVRPDERTDQQLITVAARGDHAAFESLYYRHRDWCISVATRFASDPDGALDVVQETFVYLARKLPTLKLTGTLTTFLYPVLKHTALAARRRRLPRAEVPEREAAPQGSQMDAGLRSAVEALPEAQREVLMMRFVSDMSIAEIALALQVPEGTVKSRLHHAIAGINPKSS